MRPHKNQTWRPSINSAWPAEVALQKFPGAIQDFGAGAITAHPIVTAFGKRLRPTDRISVIVDLDTGTGPAKNLPSRRANGKEGRAKPSLGTRARRFQLPRHPTNFSGLIIESGFKDICCAFVERDIKGVFLCNGIESRLRDVGFPWPGAGNIEARIACHLPSETQLHEREAFFETLGQSNDAKIVQQVVFRPLTDFCRTRFRILRSRENLALKVVSR